MRIYFFLASFISFTLFAADVQIITDVSKGQGFLYQQKDKCFVVTPSHVIEGSNEIKVLTASRESYTAKLVKNFDIDLALLELKGTKRLCKSATFSQKNKLSSLLKVYEEGVLKSKLSDGSTLQTKVDIVGVDESEFLQIKPQKTKNILKQGYSGSVLFIANQPSGILLEVDEGNGYVYRSDALNKRLEKYFYPNGKKRSKEQLKSTAINEVFSGEIAKNTIVESIFIGEANSPIEFTQIRSGKRAQFNFKIINNKDRVVYKGDFDSGRDVRFAFTPKKSGKYTIKLTGVKNKGLFKFTLQQWALNSELKGEGNVIDFDEQLSSRIAFQSVAEYHFQGEANSPIEFTQIPSNERATIKLEIVNSKGKIEYKNTFDTGRDSRFAFSPQKSGLYTVKVTGVKNHGSFKFNTQQWALNSELRGEGNVVDIDEQFSSRIAFQSVAEYLFQGEANSPIEFIQIPTNERTTIKLEIVNTRGKVEYKNNFDTARESRFAFTPQKAGQYTIKVTGVKNHGSFKFNTQQWALNSELRGEGNAVDIDEQFASRIAFQSIAEYHFQGEANSPIEFTHTTTNERTSIRFEIVNARGKVEYKNNIDTARESRFAFTPKRSGKYIIKITGVKNHGSFKFNIDQWALNSELRGEGNIIDIDEQFSSRIAFQSIAEYYFQGEANSPIQFTQIPTNERTTIKLEIVNSKGKVEYKNNLDTGRDLRFAFTPQKSESYTVKITGLKNHGLFTFDIQQWALNSELRGEGNIVDIDEQFSNRIAVKSIAEYHFQGEANNPIEFSQIPTDEQASIRLEIINMEGEVEYKNNFDSVRDLSFAFTPKISGKYTVKVTGIKKHGLFEFYLSKGE